MKLIKDKKIIRILAIETSCDETSAAILEVTYLTSEAIKQAKLLNNLNINILTNIVSSQVKLHSKYGGVYPELASREHNKNIIPVIKETLYSNNKSQSLKQSNNLTIEQFNNIDYLAVTTTPGLIGSLLVGVNTVKTLSFLTGIPIIPVNHLEGHIYANFIQDEISKNPNNKIKITNKVTNSKSQIESLNHLKFNKNYKFKIENLPSFPLLALVVSGGHTSLYYIKSHMSYKLVGETIDDAAGEAYDKVAKMLGLGYPGGPIIDAYASNFQISEPKKLQVTSYKLHDLFPRPMLNSQNFNFSFSGLKTSVLYYLRGKKITKKIQEKVAYEFQEAVTDVLVEKTLKAAKKYKVKSIVLGGGVAANSRLREKFNQILATSYQLPRFFVPEKSLCTDNAAVIGAAAAYKLLKQKPVKWYDIEANSNAEL